MVIDCNDGNGLLMLGEHITRYPDICPFCFSKYPDDITDSNGHNERQEHIRKCAKLAREIREDQYERRNRRGY